MDNSPTPAQQNITNVLERLTLPRPIRWFREIISLLLWLGIVVQVLIFNIGGYLISLSPHIAIASQFRFLVLLAVISICWLMLGNHRFVAFFGYIFLYPFIFISWHVPRLLFRNWAIIVAFSPAVYIIASSLKRSFILFSVAFVSVFVICLSPNRIPIGLGMTFLGCYLIQHYINRFRLAFSPATFFAKVTETIKNIWGRLKQTDLLKPPTDTTPGSDGYEQKYGAQLLTAYSIITSLFFLGDRIRQVVNSRKVDFYLASSILYTFLLTAFIFAIEYLGLERLIPGSFTGVNNPGLLYFIGYSFDTLMTSDISPLRALSSLAQVISYVQLFGALLIIVLLVFVILTSIRERYKQDLESVVNELSSASDKLEEVLEANYLLTISALEVLLFNHSPDIMKLCLKVRRGENRVKEVSAYIDNVKKTKASGTSTELVLSESKLPSSSKDNSS
jgi:hypothetical protein